MPGLIHIYCGDGKGKTTAAVGLAVRCAGAGRNVVFAQFFKDGSSSENAMLRRMEHVHVMHCSTVRGFWKRMTDAQRAQTREDHTKFFSEVLAAAEKADLLVLDEIVSACNHGTVSEAAVLDFLRTKPAQLEVVLTGRGPSGSLVEQADYVTEMQKIKHPFDHGIRARKGVEF